MKINDKKFYLALHSIRQGQAVFTVTDTPNKLGDVAYHSEAEVQKLRAALTDIMKHAKEPFLGPKWATYIYEVAEKALK